MASFSTPFISPPGYAPIKVVGSFDELVSTPLDHGVNALCWRRTLSGDFCEVVRQLAAREDIATVDEARLATLELSAAGRVAVARLRQDLQLLRGHGLAPSLDCIPEYPRDDEGAIVPTDVYSFHADSATVPTDTFLCSYTEASSEGLRNDEARRYVDEPATRAALLEVYGGPDDEAFRDYLRENCYDLHYRALPAARAFSFGLGNLWRIAVEFPGSPVPPCVHRAPETRPGQLARLLLIS